jgi:hypothetical protein
VCSVLRGLVGAEAHARWCVHEGLDGKRCPQPLVCAYGRVFETPGHLVPGSRGREAVRPYWVSAVPAAHELPEGFRLSAELRLVGHARVEVEGLAECLRRAVTRLGAEAGGEASLVLDGRVEREVRTLTPRTDPWSRAFVALRTPVVGRVRNKPLCAEECPSAPQLAWLARLARDRLRALHAGYAGDAPGAACRTTMPELHGLKVVEHRLEGWTGARTSRRQGRRMPLAGLMGWAVIEGPGAAELAELLELAGRVHVGDLAAFGFGRIEVQALG